MMILIISLPQVGDSLPSGHSKDCLTPEDVPYKNPDNVLGRGTQPNNLVISWTVSNLSHLAFLVSSVAVNVILVILPGGGREGGNTNVRE